FDERGEFLTQSLGVSAAEVDLVGSAVECERDRLLGLTAVKVINEKDLDFSCHESLLRNPKSNWPLRPVPPFIPPVQDSNLWERTIRSGLRKQPIVACVLPQARIPGSEPRRLVVSFTES